MTRDLGSMINSPLYFCAVSADVALEFVRVVDGGRSVSSEL